MRAGQRVAYVAVRLTALAVIGALLAGCELLYPPSEDFGGAIASYGSGHATMTIGGEKIELDQIAPGPHLMKDLGAEVYWFNDDGWGLRLSGGGDLGSAFGSPFGLPATVSIDRVRTTYWSTMADDSTCKVNLDEVGEKGLHGTATCTGLRWSDVLRGGIGTFDGGEGGRYVESEPPFDATIEFEALPKAPTT